MSSTPATGDGEVRIVNCAVCGSDASDALFTLARATIVRCRVCGMEYVRKVPVGAEVLCYWFPAADREAPGVAIDLEYLLGVLGQRGMTGARLLDLGCGEGRLLRGLVRAGWRQDDIYLIDRFAPALDAAHAICPRAHHTLADAERDLPYRDFFDVILMVEFLEDVPEPLTVMANAVAALRSGGLIIARGMPNSESVEAFLARERWKMRVVDHHYHFFSPSLFGRFMAAFPSARLIEFGPFLRQRHRFYSIERIARDLGVLPASMHAESMQDATRRLNPDELARGVLEIIRSADWTNYRHHGRLPIERLASLDGPASIEAFFDAIHLDHILAPDFSAVITKLDE